MLFRKTLTLGLYCSDDKRQLSGSRIIQMRVRYNDERDSLSASLKVDGHFVRPMTLDMSRVRPAQGFNLDIIHTLSRIAATWGADIHAIATPRQMEQYAEVLLMTKGDMGQAEAFMLESDFALDNGHRFGDFVKVRPLIPVEVLRFIFDLPGEGATWSEVNPEPFDETMFLSIIAAQ